MRWLIATTILVGLCTGCMNPQSRIDPFFGRQVIPPPGTGTAGTAVLPSNEPPPAEYYQGGSQLPRTSSTTSPTIDPYAPRDGSFEYQGNNVARGVGLTTERVDENTAGFRPPNVARTQPSATTPATSAAGATGIPLRATGPDDGPPRAAGTTDTRSSDIRVNTNTSVNGSPAPGAGSATAPSATPPTTNSRVTDPYQNYPAPATGVQPTDPYPPATSTAPRRSAAVPASADQPVVSFREPKLFQPEGEARDIMELPPAAQSSQTSEQRLAAQGMLRTASYREPKDDDADAETPRPALPLSPRLGSATIPETAGPYGFDRDGYTWLKGKLEYSLAERCWKLRYIPLTDPADEFGGRIALVATSELGSKFRPGDYVTVLGVLADGETPAGQAVSQFEVQTIQRTGK